MGSIVFVHGTGVRQPAYENAYKVIKNRVELDLPNYDIVPCYWGDQEGSRLRSNGASIPSYDTARAANEVEAEDVEIARWRILYEDPDYELRSLTRQGAGPAVFAPGGPTSLEIFLDLLPSETRTVRDRVSAAGLQDVWNSANINLSNSTVLQTALTNQPDLTAEILGTIARALVARAVTTAFAGQGERADLPTGKQRDAVVEALCEAWGGDERSITGWVGDHLKHVALKFATSKVARKRGSISDFAYPAPGDVLLYQARGDGIRSFIENTIAHAAKPVVLLTHSLGSIASFDLLASKKAGNVELLITVGSQVPLLYELDALHHLRHGSEVPDWFPDWVNIYDRRDFLSYIGELVFKGCVTDVEVNNGQPFPESHGAYWRNPMVWDAIADRIK
jgi:hypothetical protein